MYCFSTITVILFLLGSGLLKFWNQFPFLNYMHFPCEAIIHVKIEIYIFWDMRYFFYIYYGSRLFPKKYLKLVQVILKFNIGICWTLINDHYSSTINECHSNVLWGWYTYRIGPNTLSLLFTISLKSLSYSRAWFDEFDQEF